MTTTAHAVVQLDHDETRPATMFDPALTYYADGTPVRMTTVFGSQDGVADGMVPGHPYAFQRVMWEDGTRERVAPHVLARTPGASVPRAPRDTPLPYEYRTPAAQRHFDLIWQGKRTGFSEADVRAGLAEARRDLDAFNARRRTPRRVLGEGATRAAAFEWLTKQVAEYEADLASQGRTNTVNRSNVRHAMLTGTLGQEQGE